MDPDDFHFHKVPNTPSSQFGNHALISDQVTPKDIAIVWRELRKVLQAKTPGAIVEFGCYAGTTSLFIRRLLDEEGVSDSHPFHVYDSFQGLPEKTKPDESPAGTAFRAGKLSVSKKVFLQQFRNAHLNPPIIHSGWFEDLTDADIPSPIAFAFLDGDFYRSIYTSLAFVWERLAPSGVVLIDDFQRSALPGPERAVTDFFRHRPKPAIHTEHSIAIVTPN